jgi:hypothetical protein
LDGSQRRRQHLPVLDRSSRGRIGRHHRSANPGERELRRRHTGNLINTGALRVRPVRANLHARIYEQPDTGQRVRASAVWHAHRVAAHARKRAVAHRHNDRVQRRGTNRTNGSHRGDWGHGSNRSNRGDRPNGSHRGDGCHRSNRRHRTHGRHWTNGPNRSQRSHRGNWPHRRDR